MTLKRLWNNLTKPPASQKTAEENLGIAVLAIVDKYKLEVGRGFAGACVGHMDGAGRNIPAVHFLIEVCDQSEICFGPTHAEGVSIQ